MKTLADWNKRPDLQDQLDVFMRSEAWTFADEVIRGLFPRHQRGVVLDVVTAHIELGRVNGWLDYRNLLELMRKEIVLAGGEPMEPDFGTDYTARKP